MQRQVESWRQSHERAKLILYWAFVDGKLDAPRSLLGDTHRLDFEPQYPEFAPRTVWSLSNAFTSSFKVLDPVPQFKATAKLGEFLSNLPATLPQCRRKICRLSTQERETLAHTILNSCFKHVRLGVVICTKIYQVGNRVFLTPTLKNKLLRPRTRSIAHIECSPSSWRCTKIRHMSKAVFLDGK